MNKMKSKKYRTVGTVPKSNRKIIETEVKSIIQTHTYTFWYGTGTSIKSGRVKLVLWAQMNVKKNLHKFSKN
jgi:cell division protein FtsB